jgi:aspartyl protease family protein
MLKLVVWTVVGASVVAAIPHYASQFQGRLADRQAAEAQSAVGDLARVQDSVTAPAVKPTYQASYAAGRSIRLMADEKGHFTGNFRVNGTPLQGLIDTGATYVAVNQSTARRLGVALSPSDFVYGVQTANGETKAAKVTLSHVEVGSLRVEDVEAFVLQDQNISVNLIGMSFLNKLKSFQVADGELLLVN